MIENNNIGDIMLIRFASSRKANIAPRNSPKAYHRFEGLVLRYA
jgi:hypothetical protein